MLRPIDNYFLEHDSKTNSCLQFLREYILKQDENISEMYKYQMPFFCYKNKACCYLWVHKKYKKPYIGIVEGAKVNHPDLIRENRVRMKILLIDPDKDIPIDVIDEILRQVINLYEKIDLPQSAKSATPK